MQLKLSYLNLHSDRDRAEKRESETDNTGHSPMTTLKGIWGAERKGREDESRAAAKYWMDFWFKLGP